MATCSSIRKFKLDVNQGWGQLRASELVDELARAFGRQKIDKGGATKVASKGSGQVERENI